MMGVAGIGSLHLSHYNKAAHQAPFFLARNRALIALFETHPPCSISSGVLGTLLHFYFCAFVSVCAFVLMLKNFNEMTVYEQKNYLNHELTDYSSKFSRSIQARCIGSAQQAKR
jgi:hypothetical protein